MSKLESRERPALSLCSNGEPKPNFELDHLDQLVDVLEFLFFEFECDHVAGGAGGRGDKDLDF